MSPSSYTTLCASGNTKTLDYCDSTCQYGDSTRCNTGYCGAPPECNNLEAGSSSCTTAGGIAGTCSNSCVCNPVCVNNVDGDSYFTEGAECGAVDCDDGNANIYPGSCHADAITWPSTCATSTTGGCGSGTCTRVTDGVVCGTQDCDPNDTTCRNYDDVSIACSGGSCPGSAPCNSYTNAPVTTACGSATLFCSLGDNPYCSGGNIWADTDYDPSCTRYCDGGGSCEPSCDPGSCDTALWIPCYDSCSGEASPSHLVQDSAVSDYEPCSSPATSCPSPAVSSDSCGAGNVLTEWYCLPIDANSVNKDCDDYDAACSGTCGSGTDSCIQIEYGCSPGGGQAFCSFALNDLDTSSGLCSGCSAQGAVWSTGGEAAAFGEYDTGTSTECCGDDSNEKYRSTAKGGNTYSACCNLATDCVEVGNACVPTGTQSDGFICTSGQWFDGDLESPPPPANCDAAVGPGNWDLGGEVVATPCCGDDSGENAWYRKCASGACVDVPSDRKCCDAPTDCVFNGQCYSDVNKAMFLVESPTSDCNGLKNKAACESGKAKEECIWHAALNRCTVSKASVQALGTGNLSAYADVDNDGTAEVCVASSPGEWQETAGTVTGTVRNVSTGDQCVAQCPAPCVLGCPVGGAVVKVLGTALSATTDAAGAYTVANVPSRTHDLVAAKSGYEAGTAYGVFVPDAATVTVDFTLVRALGGCEDDCTAVGSNLCDATCHGKGLCWFYSDATKAACDGTFGIIEMPGGLMNVDCCKGQPYSPIKADITVPSKNVIVSKKPVLYHGKFINMVMVVFNR
ncbi:carboxypeptidase regulatory-like domain-containing protein [Candidatus Woesearchaeota archaeon]|nr:carboxypeptidase regulatory-like domain-containing protein [Candidatus Woesearchaeota archaeon]